MSLGEGRSERRSEAAALLRRHRTHLPDAAVALRDLLLAELRGDQDAGYGRSLPPVVTECSSPLGYHLARLELDKRARRARATETLASEWRDLAQAPNLKARRMLADLGILATAAAIQQPHDGPPPLHVAHILHPFGPERLGLVLTRRLVANLEGVLGSGEQAVICDLVERLGRDVTDSALAMAVGRRIFTTDWHFRSALEQTAFRDLAAPGTLALLAPFDPLPLQGASVRSLLAIAARISR